MAHFGENLAKKPVSEGIWDGTRFQQVFLRPNDPTRDPPGQEKTSKTIGLLFKNKVRTNMGKVALGRGLGLHFGGLWDHFLDTLVAFGRDLDVIGGPGGGFGGGPAP